MTSTYGEKSFDVMKWPHATREQVYEETKEMSFEEKRRWTEERIRRDPLQAMLYDSAEGGRLADGTPRDIRSPGGARNEARRWPEAVRLCEVDA